MGRQSTNIQTSKGDESSRVEDEARGKPAMEDHARLTAYLVLSSCIGGTSFTPLGCLFPPFRTQWPPLVGDSFMTPLRPYGRELREVSEGRDCNEVG